MNRYLLLWLLCLPLLAWSQKSEIIYLENSSFEDMPRASLAPTGWSDCGHVGESPPDIQPYGGFNVTKPAHDGGTYLGMVVRDNNTWESVSQKLAKPIQKGTCYNFSLYLSRSETYISPTKKDQSSLVNFNGGAILRIWGSTSHCDKRELLAETSVVDHTTWKQYEFKLEPQRANYAYITFEVYFKSATLFPYNGNILIDNASAITSCDIPLEIDNPLATNDTDNNNPTPNPPKPPRIDDSHTEEVTDDTKPVDVPKPPKETPQEDRGEFKPDINVGDLEIGNTFRLENLRFEADSSRITDSAEKTLNELFDFMEDNSGVYIEVGGHTNGLPPDDYCDKLSSDRARNVALYLIRKGIPRERITYKGYGKREPIATNETKVGRQTNQRVEIKIVELKQ